MPLPSGLAFFGIMAIFYPILFFKNTATSQSFDFEDVTNTANTESETGLVMTATPALKWTLAGSCMPDTDQDGILDIYEDINQDDNLADNETDQDGSPNYKDPNDDGDGVLIKYEGAEAAGVINKPSEANCFFKKVKVHKSLCYSAIPRAIGIAQQS